MKSSISNARASIIRPLQAASIALATAITLSCTSDDGGEVEFGRLVDERGSQPYTVYKTVVIGNQEWMAENLKYNVGICYGEENQIQSQNRNCEEYGHLYDWATAMGISYTYNNSRYYFEADYDEDFEPHKGICPKGWHIPSDGEWNALITAVNGLSKSAAKLKAASKLWEDKGGGTDEYGFAALPGGYAYYSSASSSYNSGYRSLSIDKIGTWWSITEDNSHQAFSRKMEYDADFVSRIPEEKSRYLSIRCVRKYQKGSVDNGSSSSIASSSGSNTFEDARDGKVYKYTTIGTQTWMAENLDYRGDKNSLGVCYDKKSENCDKYGRLYDWTTASTVCPSGWRLPTEAQWLTLLNNMSVGADAKELKAKSGWKNNGNGTDSYKFAALPGGYGRSSTFNAAGTSGVWWSATQTNTASAENVYMNSNSNIAGWDSQSKEFLFSVRCISN